jgi:hypothetical protein
LTPERWQHIARIYELAVEQDLSTRDKVLSDACAGDETLRREVELLLQQETAPGILDRPMWATAALLFDDGPDLRDMRFMSIEQFGGGLSSETYVTGPSAAAAPSTRWN